MFGSAAARPSDESRSSQTGFNVEPFGPAALYWEVPPAAVIYLSIVGRFIPLLRFCTVIPATTFVCTRPDRVIPVAQDLAIVLGHTLAISGLATVVSTAGSLRA